jgi:hypothetical protein
MHEALKETVARMRGLGEVLSPFNCAKNEDDISVLKTREIVVDGYEVVVYYTKSHGYPKGADHSTEVLQIYGSYSPFLPFNLICKLAKAFLGNEHLSLVELFKGNRKVYCWAVNQDSSGKVIPTPFEVEVEQCTFEGLKYSYMQPNQVNFY